MRHQRVVGANAKAQRARESLRVGPSPCMAISRDQKREEKSNPADIEECESHKTDN